VRRVLSFSGLAVVLACGAGAGCRGGSPAELVVVPEPGPSVSDAALDGIAADGADAGAEASAEGSDDAGGADAARVIVGIVANARTEADAGEGPGNPAEALVTAMAAGARGFVLAERWSELAGSSKPVSPAWKGIADQAALLRSNGRVVLFSIRTVNATIDERPVDIKASAWNSLATLGRMHDLLDETFATFGSELGYLSVGNEVDRYLDTHPGERDAFVAFALDAIAYAREHPKRPSDLVVGVTWSAGTWLGKSTQPAASEKLAAASAGLMVAYDPLDDALRARAPLEAAAQVASLADLVPGKPIVVERVGYPSSRLISGGEASQAQFVDGLFAAIKDRRARFPFVAVSALHDPPPEECLGYGTAEGQAGSAELYAFWCSTGLRTRTGAAKLAFASYLAGAAMYLDP
jgi:hypothetical protein